MAKKTTTKASTKKTSKSAPAKSGEAIHTGTVVRGDGKRVTVTVPEDDAPAPQLTIFRDGPGGAYRWRRGDSVSAKRYMAREQAERAARKAHPGAEITHEHEPKKDRAPKGEAGPAAATGEKRSRRERIPDSPGGRAMRIHRNLADKPNRVSLLDAAATVLADAKASMQAKQIVEEVIERGLWKPGAGKTPHATLYAAILREINVKGKDARFAKTDRGLFTLTK